MEAFSYETMILAAKNNEEINSILNVALRDKECSSLEKDHYNYNRLCLVAKSKKGFSFGVNFELNQVS